MRGGPFLWLWVRYSEAGFGLVGVVAASVSEWMSFHSLTLAATPAMKKMREKRHRGGSALAPRGLPRGPLLVRNGNDLPVDFFRRFGLAGNGQQPVERNIE